AAAAGTVPFVAWLIAGRHDLAAGGHGAACRVTPPQVAATRSRQGDLCAAGFSLSARSDRARAVSGRPARGMGRDQTRREPANVRGRRAGWAAASPAHHHRWLYCVDPWRAVDRRHALSRALHASLFLAHAVVANRPGGDERQPLAAARRACHGVLGAVTLIVVPIRLGDALHAM